MTARHYFAIVAVMLISCLECSAEAQPTRVEDFRVDYGIVNRSARSQTEVGPEDNTSHPRSMLVRIQPRRQVQASQLCAVKTALRGHWSPKMCERVAVALNKTPAPVLFAALMVNESDMREEAVANPKPGVLDIGLLGIRCVLDGHGRCMNGPVIGTPWMWLKHPEDNIKAAVEVYEMHKGNLRGYSGSTKERGYGARIAVLVAAFGGELRIPKGAHGKKWARVRELAKRIVGAINNERKQS